MSKRSGGRFGVVRRAAWWLPVLFCTMRALAQTAGLAAPVLASGSGVNLAQMPAEVARFVPAVTPVAVDAGGAEYPLLDGAGSVVTDISGNGNNATLATGANAPGWLPWGGLSFNDASGNASAVSPKYVFTPVTAWASLEAQVCMPTMGTTTGTGGPSNPSAQYPTLWGPNSGSGVSALFANANGWTQYGSSAYPTLYNVTGTFGSTSLLPYGNCHVYTWTLAADQDHFYVDGVEGFYSSAGHSAGAATSTAGYVIGALGTSAPNTPLHGQLRYLKVWRSTVLTAAQAQSDAAYVQGRVNARVTTPLFPLVGNGTLNGGWTDSYPRVVCAGDSLTAGAAGGGASWCDSMALNNSYASENWGISGAHVVDVDRSAEMRWLPRLNANSVVVIGGGSNDASLGMSAASTWQAMRSAIAKARPAAKTVFYWTVPSRDGTDSARDAVNAMYRAGAAGTGAVLIDIAAVPQLGADGASTNTACFNSDRTHLTGPPNAAGTCAGGLTGYGLLAKYVANAINEADGSTAANPDVTSANNGGWRTYLHDVSLESTLTASSSAVGALGAHSQGPGG